MRILIIGSGYVGLVSGTCFAEVGNSVTCVDIDEGKIEKLKQGIVPIYEPGLSQLVIKNIESNNLNFSNSLKDNIQDCEIVFIAVGTPMNPDGSASMEHVFSAAKEIGSYMNNSLIIVNKSTVPIGTADKVRNTINEELYKRKISIDFEVISNPEFLKEGDAINDFMKPDRVVIGSDSKMAVLKMKQLYSPFFRTHDRFVTMGVRSAEMTKYAANAMLATKISFMNEIANICEKVGADVNEVRVGIGSDNRIGYSFIYPGVGYGGSCFPKDVKALKKTAEDYNYKPRLLEAVEVINDSQKLLIAKKIINRFGEDLKGKTFSLWGLSFKPGTDDMREAPAIYVIRELTKRGAKINAYDPKAMDGAKSYYLKGNNSVNYYESKYSTLDKSDALILLTEWKEFRSPNFELIKERLNKPIIFDGRNQYNAFQLDEKGFEYYQIGKK